MRASGGSFAEFMVNAEPVAESCGEFPFDMHRFRTVFPDRWAALLKAHFRDIRHISFFFDVSERTARDWLNGVSAPAGPFAVVACARIPGAIEQLMRAA